jgi:biopolymer transport protein ExbB
VIGIISAFNAITHDGVGDPKVLSGGIGQALITTAAGLCVAIPSLMGYRYLRGRVDELVIAMEKEALRLIQSLDAQRSTPPGAAGDATRTPAA